MNNSPLIRVAYAEDQVAVRKGIISALESLGGVIFDIQADDGVELMQQLQAAKQLPDIVIIDINMPRMNGFILQVELKKCWPEIRTLILTSFNNDTYIIKMIQNGANGYLLKTSEPTEIKKALEYIYHSGYYYSQVADNTKFASVQNKTLKPLVLTDTEKEFLKYCCTDMSYSEIADKLNTTLRSIDGYRDRLFAKLKVRSRVGLVIFAIQSGIVTMEFVNQINEKK